MKQMVRDLLRVWVIICLFLCMLPMKTAAASKVQIVQQPEGVIVINGEMATVSVAATGEGLTFQWYYTSNRRTNTFYKSSVTSNTYSIIMNPERSGRKVYCVVTDRYGNTVKSDTTYLCMVGEVNTVKIDRQPVGETVNEGWDASVCVVADGDGLTYQWYYTSNGTSNVFYKSSNTTNRYTTVMNASRAGRKVYCVVRDQYGNVEKSQTVTLNMTFRGEMQKVKIEKQPESIIVDSGTTPKISVDAIGDGLTYQWYYTSNGRNNTYYKSSNTTKTYSTSMDASKSGRKVYCVVTDRYGNKEKSQVASITVRDCMKQLKITQQPVGVTVQNGETAKAIVKAVGDGLKYQWYYTSNASSSKYKVSTMTGTAYSTVMDAAKDGRMIYCVISDMYGNKVESNKVKLRMTGPLAFREQPKGMSVFADEGYSTSVVVTGGEEPYSYQWQIKVGDNYRSITQDVYPDASGMNEATLTFKRGGISSVRCVVTDAEGTTITSEAAEITGKRKLSIDPYPANTNRIVYVSKGEIASTWVNATGDGLKYQWYYIPNGQEGKAYKANNTTSNYSLTMDETNSGQKVYCVVTDQYGNSEQSETVTFSTFYLTSQPKSMDTYPGTRDVMFKVEATGGCEPYTYEWYRVGVDGVVCCNTQAYYFISVEPRHEGAYYCLVKDSRNNIVKSETVNLFYLDPLSFSEDLVDRYALIGEEACLEVKAEGGRAPYTYQWQLYDNNTKKYVDIDDSYNWIKDGDSSKLRINIEDDYFDKYYNYTYRCVVTDANGKKEWSKEARIKKASIIIVADGPENAAFGSEVTLTAKVLGGMGNYTYRWQCKSNTSEYWDVLNVDPYLYSVVDSEEESTLTYRISNSREYQYSYRCVVTDDKGNSGVSNSVMVSEK